MRFVTYESDDPDMTGTGLMLEEDYKSMLADTEKHRKEQAEKRGDPYQLLPDRIISRFEATTWEEAKILWRSKWA